MAVCTLCRSVIQNDARFCPHCGTEQSEQPQRGRIGQGTQLDLGWGKAVVGRVIGEGGMGIVFGGWLYYNPEGSRSGTAPHPVAVKALHPMLKGRERARQLFLGEAKALARLSHPNIVHFFGLSEQMGQLAIVIELVEGQPLSDVIEDHWPRFLNFGYPGVSPFFTRRKNC